MDANRHIKLLIGLGVIVLILLGKLFFIQIIDGSYKSMAQNNAMVYKPIYPPRGLILDRNGNVLVRNRITYDILVYPKEVSAFDTVALASVLDTTADYIRDRFSYYRKYRTRIGGQPQTIIKGMSSGDYLEFAELKYEFPGFEARMRTVRDYPVNACGNLLGYISEVDADYLKAHPDEYKVGDYAGRTGIEASRETDLRGEKGYHIYLRDSRNRITTSYKDGAEDRDAIPGKDITTTIDSDLQQYGQLLMTGKTGSLVAIEPSSGEILAMVSSPGIDTYMLGDMGRYYNRLIKDKGKPMFNRTVQASYPPGSVFKLINGLIGLQEGVLSPQTRYPCHNGYEYSKNHKLRCHSHYSPLNLDQAVMMSCNGYFCYVFKSILQNDKYSGTSEAFNVWRDYVTSFGFGSALGSDFPGELGGNIPTSSYYDRMYGKGRWRFPTIVSLSIGQGEIGATPLQIANLAATVANRGFYYIPHIIKESSAVELDSRYKEKHYTKVDSTQFPKVISGMWKAVNAGWDTGATAAIACVPGLDICGKTGTAQNPHGKDHSVFICFAPMDNPRIAVAAYVENAGFGATWASPVASLLVEKYLNGTISPERKPLEERIIKTTLTAK